MQSLAIPVEEAVRELPEDRFIPLHILEHLRTEKLRRKGGKGLGFLYEFSNFGEKFLGFFCHFSPFSGLGWGRGSLYFSITLRVFFGLKAFWTLEWVEAMIRQVHVMTQKIWVERIHLDNGSVTHCQINCPVHLSNC